MNAEIIAVGTELLMGQIANTNAQFLSTELSGLGIMVYNHTVVGDNPRRIAEALDIALARAGVVILTGGLGPTDDDLTKETVAKHLGLELELDHRSFDRMIQYFNKLNCSMPTSNRKQAMLPKGCVVLDNNYGTAPGCLMEHDNKRIILLPGPPIEMSHMFTDCCAPLLAGLSENSLTSEYVHIFGLGESFVQDKIKHLLESEDPTLAPYVKDGIITLRVTTTDKGKIADMLKKIKDELGENIFYTGEQTTLEEYVCKRLVESGKTLSTAESCTGGMLAAAVTSYPGISNSFLGGFVTYSNEQKKRALNVSPAVLEKHGAVSAETAEQMAVGCKTVVGTDYAISITGIAGPSGGSDSKPVGLVYIGLAGQNGVCVKELQINGTRSRVRRMSMLNAFYMLLQELTLLQ